MRLFQLLFVAVFLSVPLSMGCGGPAGGTTELGDAEVDPEASTEPEPDY